MRVRERDIKSEGERYIEGEGERDVERCNVIDPFRGRGESIDSQFLSSMILNGFRTSKNRFFISS